MRPIIIWQISISCIYIFLAVSLGETQSPLEKNITLIKMKMEVTARCEGCNDTIILPTAKDQVVLKITNNIERGDKGPIVLVRKNSTNVLKPLEKTIKIGFNETKSIAIEINPNIEKNQFVYEYRFENAQEKLGTIKLLFNVSTSEQPSASVSPTVAPTANLTVMPESAQTESKEDEKQVEKNRRDESIIMVEKENEKLKKEIEELEKEKNNSKKIIEVIMKIIKWGIGVIGVIIVFFISKKHALPWMKNTRISSTPPQQKLQSLKDRMLEFSSLLNDAKEAMESQASPQLSERQNIDQKLTHMSSIIPEMEKTLNELLSNSTNDTAKPKTTKEQEFMSGILKILGTKNLQETEKKIKELQNNGEELVQENKKGQAAAKSQ